MKYMTKIAKRWIRRAFEITADSTGRGMNYTLSPKTHKFLIHGNLLTRAKDVGTAVEVALVKRELRGHGVGKFMYNLAKHDAMKAGAKKFTSSSTGATSEGAEKIWKSLGKTNKVNISKKKYTPKYSIDLI